MSFFTQSIRPWLPRLAVAACLGALLANCSAPAQSQTEADLDAQAQEIRDADGVVLLEPVDQDCTEGLGDCLLDVLGKCPRCRGLLGPALGWNKGLQCPPSLEEVLNRPSPASGQLPDLEGYDPTDCMVLVGNAPNSAMISAGEFLEQKGGELGKKLFYRASLWAGKKLLRALPQLPAIIGQVAIGTRENWVVVMNPNTTPEQRAGAIQRIEASPPAEVFIPGTQFGCN